MKNRKRGLTYESPNIAVLAMVTEQFIAASAALQDIEKNDIYDETF